MQSRRLKAATSSEAAWHLAWLCAAAVVFASVVMTTGASTLKVEA
jgi:hypothetical protein